MLRIGCHLSSSKGYTHMAEEAVSIGANTFAFFTRNPRGGSFKKDDPEDIQKFLSFCEEHDIAKIVAHAPYTMNPCSADPHIREFSATMMKQDLEKLQNIPGNYYNFHPGSHVGQGEDVGISFTASMLNSVLDKQLATTVLIETMAGKGSEIGKTFEQIAALLSGVKEEQLVGVCLDTCHVFDGGYDIVQGLDEVLLSFDKIIGLSKLRAVHINDSLNPLRSAKDRHARIGQGHIGTDAFARIVNHEALRDLPFILETPNDLAGYAEEISLLRSLYHQA